MNLTSRHDAKVPFGIEVPQGYRKKCIQRHTHTPKSKMADVGHLGKYDQLITSEPLVIETIVIPVFILICGQ